MGFKNTAKSALISGAIMAAGATAPNNQGSVPVVAKADALAKVAAAENAARMRTQTRDAGVRKGGNSGKK